MLRFVRPASSSSAKAAVLGELAAAESRVRALAPEVRKFAARVAAAEAAGKQPDRDALGFLMTRLEALDAEHWGAGAGAGCASAGAAGAAYEALRDDRDVAAAAGKVLRAHPLYVPSARILEAVAALNGEELALTRRAVAKARERDVPVRSREFERVQQAAVRDRLAELGVDAGAGASTAQLVAAVCADLAPVASVWTSVVQLAVAAERAGVAGYEGFENSVGQLTTRLKSAFEAPIPPPPISIFQPLIHFLARAEDMEKIMLAAAEEEG